MKKEYSVIFEKELNSLVEEYLSAANFIGRKKNTNERLRFSDLRKDDNIHFYSNKYDELLSNIIEIIINPLIKLILESCGYEYYFCNVPNKSFEFVFVKHDIGYAVAYDGDYYDYEYLLDATHTSKVLNICLNNLTEDYLVMADIVDELTLKYFMINCLNVSAEHYDLLCSKIHYAYNLASDKLSVSVNRKISDYSIKDYQEVVKNDLRKNFYDDILNKKINLIYYSGENFDIENVIYNEDIVNIAKRFCNLYYALYGNEDFATSFVTAEYLYGIFEEGMMMDYTPVILGYIKALEQLFRRIAKGYNLSVRGNGNMSPTFGNFIGAIQANLRDISYKDAIIYANRFTPKEKKTEIMYSKMLKDFNTNARCDYIHESNISSKETVGRIRNDARILLFLTLGGLFADRSYSDLADILGAKENSKYTAFRNFISKADIKSDFVHFYCSNDNRRNGRYGKIAEISSDNVIIVENKTNKVFIFDKDFFPYRYEYMCDADSDIIKSGVPFKKFFDNFHPKRTLGYIYRIEAVIDTYSLDEEQISRYMANDIDDDFVYDYDEYRLINRHEFEEMKNTPTSPFFAEALEERLETSANSEIITYVCMNKKELQEKREEYLKRFEDFLYAEQRLWGPYQDIEETDKYINEGEFKRKVKAIYSHNRFEYTLTITIDKVRGDKCLYSK